MSDQQSVSKDIAFVVSPNGERKLLMDTLRSLKKASEEMAANIRELETMTEEFKAVREELEQLRIVLDTVALEWSVNPIGEKAKKLNKNPGE